MDLSSKLRDLSGVVEGWAERLAMPSGLTSETVSAAARYALFSGGKRIRPVFSLLVAELLDVERELLQRFAVALELIHTSSLIHDDLPGLDNDDFRRGKPTCHKVYGEGTAIIAGDFLIARAFELVLEAGEVPAETRAAWAKLLSTATVALCDGQGLDLEHMAGKGMEHFAAASPEERATLLLQCHRKKTAALFRAAALGAAQLVPWAEPAGLRSDMAALGEEIGLIFQLTDDLLDAADVPAGEGEGATQGFSVVAVLGKERAGELIEEKLARLRSVLEPFGQKAAYLKAFIAGVSSRKY